MRHQPDLSLKRTVRQQVAAGVDRLPAMRLPSESVHESTAVASEPMTVSVLPAMPA